MYLDAPAVPFACKCNPPERLAAQMDGNGTTQPSGATAEISGKLKLQSLSQSIPRSYRMEIEVPPQLKNAEKSTVTVAGTTIEGTDVKYSSRLAPCSGTTTGNEAQ